MSLDIIPLHSWPVLVPSRTSAILLSEAETTSDFMPYAPPPDFWVCFGGTGMRKDVLSHLSSLWSLLYDCFPQWH